MKLIITDLDEITATDINKGKGKRVKACVEENVSSDVKFYDDLTFYNIDEMFETLL